MSMQTEIVRTRIQDVIEGLVGERVPGSADSERHSLKTRMATYRVPGVSIAIADGGELEWAGGFGQADDEREVTPETVFQACSISKPAAALAALRLVDRGVLNLDKDVNTYLKTWKVPTCDGVDIPITVRQLLTHTAGLTVHGFMGYRHDEAVPTRMQILSGEPPANNDAIRIDTVPGLSWRYSGGGYCVLEQVLEDITDTSFETLMYELVLEPLGMNRSHYGTPHGTVARSHYYSGKAVEGGWYVMPELAAAGLWTTPSDLVRFALAIQRCREGQSDLLSTELAHAMVRQQATVGPDTGMGLGVFIGLQDRAPNGAPSFFGHSGANIGQRCNLRATYDDGKVVAIMTNSDSGEYLIPEINKAVVREYGWPSASEKGTDSGAFVPKNAIGVYKIADKELTIEISGGEAGLKLHVNSTALPLKALGGTRYAAVGLRADVLFASDEGGKITSLNIRQNEQDNIATRQ